MTKGKHSLIYHCYSDDSTAIMRSYLEETIAKSVKVPNKGKKKATSCLMDEEPSAQTEIVNSAQNTALSLASATEEQLIVELARRRAAKFQLSGSMKRLTEDNDDPTGQICTLNGDNGTIPCRELME